MVLRYAEVDRRSLRPWFIDSFREEFAIWTKEILDEGFESNEIVSRPLISSKYHEALWVQLCILQEFGRMMKVKIFR